VDVINNVDAQRPFDDVNRNDISVVATISFRLVCWPTVCIETHL